LEKPLIGFDLKFAKLPTLDETFDSVDAETMGWGAIETNGSKKFLTFYFLNIYKLSLISQIIFILLDFSDILLKTDLKTMTNEVCKEKILAFSNRPKTDPVEPSHICAGGRYPSNPSTNLENDSCQVYFENYQISSRNINLQFSLYLIQRETVEVLFELATF